MDAIEKFKQLLEQLYDAIKDYQTEPKSNIVQIAYEITTLAYLIEQYYGANMQGSQKQKAINDIKSTLDKICTLKETLK